MAATNDVDALLTKFAGEHWHLMKAWELIRGGYMVELGRPQNYTGADNIIVRGEGLRFIDAILNAYASRPEGQHD